MLRRKFLAAAVLCSLLLPATALARTPKKIYAAPQEVIEKIKAEGTGENSQVMQILSYLADNIGGRLTNSPNMKRANEWTRDKMAGWGMKNARLEAWGPFGRGWSLEEFSAQVISPQGIPVIAYPNAWSPSTNGEVTGPVILMDVKSEADLAKYKGKLKGAIVFVGTERELKADFDGMGHRFSDSDLLKMADAPNPNNARRGSGNRFDPNSPRFQNFLKARALQSMEMNMLVDEGAAVMVTNSGNGSGGTIFVSGASVATPPPKSIEDIFGGRLSPWTKEAEAKMLPQMAMATEHFNRIVRMIHNGADVKMSVNIQARYQDDDMMGYNTVAEIPGTDPDLKDEIVMLGGHLDSWHSAGGATDNGAGCAVAMEAARILLATGLKPRRTIRVALWSGEEQGLNGSQAYVAQHFGSVEGGGGRLARILGGGSGGKLVTKPDYDKFSAYYNMDNGTGQFRGVYLQGNSEVAPIFRTWLLPFSGWGASTLTLNNTGGTDHLSFDGIGLPGFQFIQDPIEYSTRTHHSNMDDYDRLQPQDLKRNSVMMAAFVYQTAMMDGKIPRKAPPGGAQ